MPQAIIAAGVAIGAAIAEAGIGALIVNALIGTALSFGINFLADVLLKPNSNSKDGPGFKGLIRASRSPHRIFYGEREAGGVISFIGNFGATNEIINIVFSVSGTHVEELGGRTDEWDYLQIYFGDRLMGPIYPVDHVPTYQTKPFEVSSGIFSNGTAGLPLIRLERRNGTREQTYFSYLRTENPEYTSSHRGKDRALIYARLRSDRNVFNSGIPNIKLRVRGRRLWDPRKSTIGISVSGKAVAGRSRLTCDAVHGRSIGDRVFILGHTGSVIDGAVDDTAPTSVDKYLFGEYEVLAVPSTLIFEIDANITTAGADGTFSVMVYSDNAALALADYIVQEFGLGANPDSEIDVADLIVAANISDEQVSLPTATPTFDFTVDSLEDNRFIKVFTEGENPERLHNLDGVRLTTTETLPDGLGLNTTYYVYQETNFRYRLCTTLANARAAITLSIDDIGAGTHTLTRLFQSRYTINAIVSRDELSINVIPDMLKAIFGTLTYNQGTYHIFAGAYIGPATIAINDDYLRADAQYSPRPGIRSRFNAVRGTFIDRDSFYQETEFEPVKDANAEANDGQELYTDIQVKFITDSVRAQRLGRLRLNRSRASRTLVLKCNARAQRIAPHDIISVSISLLHIANKEYEVLQRNLAPGGGGVDLLLKEISSGDFSDASNTVLNVPGLPLPTVVGDHRYIRYTTGTELPTDPFDGDVNTNPETGQICTYVVSTLIWDCVSPPVPNIVPDGTTGTTFPESPSDGDSHTDSTTGEFCIYQTSDTTWYCATPAANLAVTSSVGSTFPTSPSDKDTHYNLTTGQMCIYSTSEAAWICTASVLPINTFPTVTTGLTATYRPTNPADGSTHFDEVANTICTYDRGATTWNCTVLSPTFDGVTITQGEEADRPVSPVENDVFFNTDTNQIETYNGSSWDTEDWGISSTLTVSTAGNLPVGQPQGEWAWVVDEELMYVVDSGGDWRSDFAAPNIDVGGITSSLIADGAVVTAKLAALAVETANIASGAVTSTILASEAVTAAKLAALAVATANIQADAITNTQIAANSVSTGSIQANAITTSELAANSVTANEIVALTITAAELAANSIITSKIAADAITTNELAAGAVSATEIVAGTITANEMAANSITANELAVDSVTAVSITAGAITANEIAAGTITSGLMAANSIVAQSLAAGSVVADKVGANAITTGKILARAVTAAEIAVGTIKSENIETAAITADLIAAGTITGDKLTINTINADKIITNTILLGTSNLSPNAITATTYGYVASYVIPGTAVWTTGLTLAFTCTSGSVRYITAHAVHVDDISGSFTQTVVKMQIHIGGTLVGAQGPAVIFGGNHPNTGTFVDTVSRSGSVNFGIKGWSNSAGTTPRAHTLRNIVISIIEAKR